jgi:uncharacterized FAD-dependent dehydrogenase
MIQTLRLRLPPFIAYNDEALIQYAAAALAIPRNSITGIRRKRQSIDARGRQVMVQLQVEVFVNEPFHKIKTQHYAFRNAANAAPVIVVGAGPAGLFAAMKLLESGIKPIIIERGKEVQARRRDLALLMKKRIVNPDSNYCFGEGGAGAYSDGKLYTRSTKRGDIERILKLFVQHGAPENILYEAHPHIGTNKLPQIIEAFRKTITDHGGEFHFNSKVSKLILDNDICKGVQLTTGEVIEAKAVILATGHSARDIFVMLNQQNIAIMAKPFALGVRIEHPQALIDSIQYHCKNRGYYLPPASYSLTHQVNGRGVFSFCMCPGGIIAPAMTNPGEIVVNGWSPSRRNNPFANSGIVVSVEQEDFMPFIQHGALAGMYFQQSVEQKAFVVGGGNLCAPAQRMTDFVTGKISASLPQTSYHLGVTPANLWDVLPYAVASRLKEGLIVFGKKMKGYFTDQAVLIATESRTSSPVRIPRDKNTLQHPQIKHLFPCGEGAGYAGGIVSAAMDGEQCATAARALL